MKNGLSGLEIKKAKLFFIFYCPVLVQLWESTYLFHAVINSDVHLIYLRQNWRPIQLEILLCVIREATAWNIKVLTSLEEISRYSDGGTDSFLQLFRLMFLVWPLVKVKVLRAPATVLKYSELSSHSEIYLPSYFCFQLLTIPYSVLRPWGMVSLDDW